MFADVHSAKAVRDLAIECMARFNRSAVAVREHACEPYWLAYRHALGRVMGDVVLAINATIEEFRHLQPTEDEWTEVESARLSAPEIEALQSAAGAQALAPHLDDIETRLARLSLLLGPNWHPWADPTWHYPELRRIASQDWSTSPTA